MSDAEISDAEDYERLKTSQNRKNKKAGGWQALALGLDHAVAKGILKQGYQQPTPIQRKAIPPILDGKDVVAMSRTGSGKTAAFVIPMLQKLKQRDLKGARALLVSPTRELALQTFKVVKELGKFTGLRCACLVGGDNLEEHFEALHQNPDVILATPGRLLHVVVEMSLKLNHIHYVVFDEADRLFEMGFLQQLWDILKRLPDSRQTLLFSATMPKMMVEFANAGLEDPVLVRLDVDTKISDQLSMNFFLCRDCDKIPAMLHLVRQFVNKQEQTIVFCATIRHVEYYVALLKEANLESSYVHSQLDPCARRANIQRFKNKETMLLIVTDVAARGVDIPLLDNAVNIHFPEKPKLFTHRVGRVARAGRPGAAFSLISYDELPYLVDFFLFLGRDLKFATIDQEHNDAETLLGKYPEELIHMETEFLKNTHEQALEISDLQHKSENAMKKYIRTRQTPSAESVRRVKTNYRHLELAVHPYFKDTKVTKEETDFLMALKNWRPNAKIFELNDNSVMVKKVGPKLSTNKIAVNGASKRRREEEIQREKQNYVSYFPTDYYTEKALKVDNNNFANAAKSASIDITADDDKGLYKKQFAKKWDRKSKKFVAADQNTTKKIRTEDGTLIPASYRSGRYNSWVEKQKLSYADENGDDMDNTDLKKKSRKWASKQNGAQVRSERRSAPQIVKERKRKEKVRSFQQERRKKRLERNKTKTKKRV